MERRKFLSRVGLLGTGIMIAPYNSLSQIIISGKSGEIAYDISPNNIEKSEFWLGLLKVLGGVVVGKLADYVIDYISENKNEVGNKQVIKNNYPNYKTFNPNIREAYNWPNELRGNFGQNIYYNGMNNYNYYVPFHNSLRSSQHTKLGYGSVVAVNRCGEDLLQNMGMSVTDRVKYIQPFSRIGNDTFFMPSQEYQRSYYTIKSKVTISYQTNGLGEGTLRIKDNLRNFDFTYTIGYK